MSVGLLDRTCNFERMNVQRIAARAFVIAGGAFWVIAAFGASFAYEDQALSGAIGTALLPLGIALAAFLVGWFYERLAALLLVMGTLAVIVWGVAVGWETGVWVSVGLVLIVPMLLAATLFLLASRMQNICSFQQATHTA